MGDALSDLSRDEQRRDHYNEFLKGIVDYMQDSSPKNYSKVLESAKETDSVKRGYWTSRSDLSSAVENGLLDRLKQGDKKEWGRILATAPKINYQGLKNVSPFNGTVLVRIGYGNGFVKHLSIDDIDEVIEKSDLRTYDRDSYFVPISENAIGTPVWVGNFNQDTPRDAKGNPKSQ